MSGEGITVRRARKADLAEIGRIYADAVVNSTATFDFEPWTKRKLATWFRGHGDRHPLLVAESDGRVVGWASVSQYRARRGWAPTVEDAVYVAPGERGRGVGDALLARLLDETRAAGHAVVLAQVVEGNEASLRLHSKHGFAEAGTLSKVGLKFGRRLDVTILQKTLAPDAGEGKPGGP